MRTTKRLLLVVMVIATCLMLFACKKELTFEEAYDLESTNDTTIVKNVSEWTESTDWTLEASVGNYAIFSERMFSGRKTYVYNVDTCTTILSLTSGQQLYDYAVHYLTNTSIFSFTVYESGDYTTYVYDQFSNKIIETDKHLSVDSDVTNYGNFFTFDNYLYLVETNADLTVCSFSKVCATPDSYAFNLSDLSNADITDEYIVIAGSNYYSSSDTVRYYTRNLVPVANYTVPDYAQNVNYFVLSNGNLFVQYLIPVDGMLKRYDIIKDAFEKYNLAQYIIDIESGKELKVKIDGYVEWITSDLEGTLFNDENVTNVVELYPIKDKRIDTSKPELVVMGNDGKQTGTLPQSLDTACYIYDLGFDYYMAYSLLNGYALIDEDGKVIQRLLTPSYYGTNYGLCEYNSNNVYDNKMNLIFTGEGKNVVVRNDYQIIYSEINSAGDTVYYRFNGTTSEITVANGYEISYISSLANDIYMIAYDYNGDTLYEVCAADGTVLLAKSESSKTVFASGYENVIIKEAGNTSASTKYYIITK